MTTLSQVFQLNEAARAIIEKGKQQCVSILESDPSATSRKGANPLYLIGIPTKVVDDPERNPLYFPSDGDSYQKTAMDINTIWKKKGYSGAGKILASHLTPENGIKVLSTNPYSDKTNSALQAAIQKVASDILPLLKRREVPAAFYERQIDLCQQLYSSLEDSKESVRA